jgi:hypothetical protein
MSAGLGLRQRHAWMVAAMLTLAPVAGAAQQADLDALDLADKTATTTAPAQDWRLLLQAAGMHVEPRYTRPDINGERLSADFALDTALSASSRFVVQDRLDWTWPAHGQPAEKVNMLKELYATWSAKQDLILDAGRINARYGVATAYNPTDFLRAGANRSIVSLSPSDLRDNRLGSAMLRAQSLWSGASATAIYVPKLASAPSSAPFSADLGATNGTQRWLVAVSPAFGNGFNPQVLLFRRQGQPIQAGLDVTQLLNDATTAYLEWSGGEGESLAAEAGVARPDRRFRQHVSAGFTYTSAQKISLTLEAEYNGAGTDEAGWKALRGGPLAAYQRYRSLVQDEGEYPTRPAAFAMLTASDLLGLHLDLSAFERQDLMDKSHLTWLEARYHWTRADLSLQYQRFQGRRLTDFGASPQKSMIQLQLSVYQ